MSHLPPFTVMLFMAATLIILITGVIFMALGNKLDKKYSNKLMIARVAFQAITICIIGLYYLGR